MMTKPVRLNIRVSSMLNDWLDKKSAEMGVSKSALVAMAIENYRMQMEMKFLASELDNGSIFAILSKWNPFLMSAILSKWNPFLMSMKKSKTSFCGSLLGEYSKN